MQHLGGAYGQSGEQVSVTFKGELLEGEPCFPITLRGDLFIFLLNAAVLSKKTNNICIQFCTFFVPILCVSGSSCWCKDFI